MCELNYFSKIQCIVADFGTSILLPIDSNFIMIHIYSTDCHIAAFLLNCSTRIKVICVCDFLFSKWLFFLYCVKKPQSEIKYVRNYTCKQMLVWDELLAQNNENGFYFFGQITHLAHFGLKSCAGMKITYNICGKRNPPLNNVYFNMILQLYVWNFRKPFWNIIWICKSCFKYKQL